MNWPNHFARRSFFCFLFTILTYLLLPKSQRLPKSSSLIISYPATEKFNFDENKIYHQFQQLAASGVQDKPVLLHQGQVNSPLSLAVADYPRLLTEKPNNLNLVSKIKADSTFHPYPSQGKLPQIEASGLDFLHPDITEACVCFGSFREGKLVTKWLGRNALRNQEFWSATKFIPLVYLVSQINLKYPDLNISNCYIKANNREISLLQLAEDMITYQGKIATSNSIGATLKRFVPQLTLEKWLKSITGNHDLVFRGRYGDKPFIELPELYDSKTKQVILSPDTQPPYWACNDISAYDLTRLISLLGWHHYLDKNSQIPGINADSVASLVKIMGQDIARLTDLAIQALGIENQLDSLVIISKEGDGVTEIRDRTEAVYVALVQFKTKAEPSELLTLAMTLRGAIAFNPRNLDQETVTLDARMATEVTKIIKQVLTIY